MEKIVSLNLILRLRWNAVGLERNLFIKYLYKNTNEIHEKVIDILNLTEEIIDYPHGDSGRSYQTELEYQLAWVRTMLKHLGLINNTKQGVWVLTQKAKEIDWDNNYITKKYREYLKNEKEKKQKSKNGMDTVVTHDPEFIEDTYEDEKELNWKQKLKEILII